jgi:hypothetical protein
VFTTALLETTKAFIWFQKENGPPAGAQAQAQADKEVADWMQYRLGQEGKLPAHPM